MPNLASDNLPPTRTFHLGHVRAQSGRAIALLLLFLTLLFCCSCSESPKETSQRLDNEARQYIADKKYAEAISTWSKLLALQPEMPNIHKKLAMTYELNGQYQQAMSEFKAYLSRHPESKEALIHIMRIQLRLFDIAGALATWKELQRFAVDPKLRILHGDLLAAQEQYQAAIEEYKKALAHAPDNQQALVRFAVILQGRNRPEDAAYYYTLLDNLHPAAPDILLQMANYWLLTGNAVRAEHFLQQAVEKAPNVPELRLKQAELYLQQGRYANAAAIFSELLDNSPQSRFYKKMLIESLLQGREFARAEALLTSLSQAEEQDVDFLLLKGKYYLGTGNYLVAASQFEIALKKEPKLPLAHYFLALAFLASGQNCLGQQSLVRSLTLNPLFTDAELTLADCYYKTGDYDLALEHVRRILNREPENVRSYRLLGSILFAQKKYTEALTSFRRAFILDPADQSSIFYTAELSALIKKTRQAARLYQALLGKHPLLADATLLYARLLLKQKGHEKALQLINKTIAKHPKNPYFHQIAGIIHLSAGKTQQAIREFTRTTEIAPNMKEAYLQLFSLYNDNPKKLEALLMQAIAATDDFEEATLRLASLYRKNDEPEQAISLLQKAVSRHPGSPILANNLAWLYLHHQPDNLDEALRLASLAYDKLPGNAAVADTLGNIYLKKNLTTRAHWLLEEAAGLKAKRWDISQHSSNIPAK